MRLRFLNSSATATYDVRIPGLLMTVIEADGTDVQPVVTDEFRIAVAETYDVIVTLPDERAYTIFGETMDRSGFARGTLAPSAGMTCRGARAADDQSRKVMRWHGSVLLQETSPPQRFAVDDSLLVRVLDGVADLAKQFEALGDGAFVFGA